MADDSVAVLDAAGRDSAHLVGSSLGGPVAQAVALRHAERVRSLTLLSSAPADFRRAPAIRVVASVARQRLARLASRRPGPEMTPELMEETAVRMFTTGPLSSPAYPSDEDMVRQALRAEWEYSPPDPAAASRQIAALVASGSRLAALRTLRVPTLVIHGDADPNVPLRGSQAIARAIPRSRLLTFSGMGHGLPHQLWPEIAKAIADLASRADGPPSHQVN
jgi:pimeloyl-ACP methyl ester carboxylesterase